MSDIDAEDADCTGPEDVNEASPGSTCTDVTDNDGDGWTDEEDPDCLIGVDGDGSYAGAPCHDGVDNDLDGDIDGLDANCSSAFSADEGGTAGICTDLSDNDSDGWIDDEDPDCALFGSEQGFSALPCNEWQFLVFRPCIHRSDESASAIEQRQCSIHPPQRGRHTQDNRRFQGFWRDETHTSSFHPPDSSNFVAQHVSLHAVFAIGLATEVQSVAQTARFKVLVIVVVGETLNVDADVFEHSACRG